MNSRPKEELEKTEDERERDLHQDTKHWLGEKDDLHGSRETRREGAKREWERGQRPNTCTAELRARERHQGESGRPRRGPKTMVADLVGPTLKEKRQRTPQACTAPRATEGQFGKW